MRDDLGFLGIIAQDGQKIAAHAHGAYLLLRKSLSTQQL
jgi:hypothetical protein